MRSKDDSDIFLALAGDADIVDAVAGRDRGRRHGQHAALADRDPDQRALTDKVVTKAADLDIGEDTAVLDLRVDLGEAAGAALFVVAGEAGAAADGDGRPFDDLGGVALGEGEAR